MKNKLFVVRKYVSAPSALSAIRKEKKTPVHDVWISDDWEHKNKIDTYAVGFEAEPPQDEDED